jgi:uncharacterized oxidoreductase
VPSGPVTGERVRVRPERLSELIASIFTRLGADAPTAARIGESLVSAHLAGHPSHGVRLVPAWAASVRDGDVDLRAEPEIVDEAGAVVRIDAHDAIGPVAGDRAVEIARECAAQHGVAVVLMRNAGHLGRIGEYTGRLARDGFASILLTNFQGSGQRIAPPGGLDPRLSNNPVSLGMPAGDTPVVVDMALSTLSEGKIDLARLTGAPLAADALIDVGGRTVTDPAAFRAGTANLTAAGGQKGAALIILVDLLVGVLTGAGVCRPDPGPFRNAVVLVAIAVDPLVPRDEAAAAAAQLHRHVASARRLPGAGPARLPGQGTPDLHDGMIELDAVVLESVRAEARSVGVTEDAA